MKKIYLLTGLLAILCLPVFSQTKAELKQKEQIEQRIIKVDSGKFSRTEVPDKWKDESAVILYQKYMFVADRVRTTYTWHGWIHRRIKILDRAAVEKFSEMVFMQSYYNDKDFFGINIIKPDGSVIKVEPEQAVKMKGSELEDGQFVESAISYSESSSSFSKIAIPSIEIGDIIDYYSYNNYVEYGTIFNSSPLPGVWLCMDYPIVSQSVEYNLNKELSYNLKSVNGAPEIEIENSGFNILGEIELEYARYSILDSSREKISQEKFLIYNRLIPQIKADIGLAKTNYYKMYYSGHIFCAEGSGVEYTVQPSDIQDFYSKLEDPHVEDEILSKKIGGIIKKKCPNGSPVEKAKLVFYEARKTNTGDYEGAFRIFIMSQVLSKLKIDHQVLAIISKNSGSIDNVISPYELIPAICVKDSDGTELFLFAPVSNRNVNEFNYKIDGADAFVYFPKKTYKLNPANKNRMPEMRKMPQSVATDNVLNTVMNVSFDENNDMMFVKAESQITGFSKRRIIDAILYGYDITYEEDNVLGHSSSVGFVSEQDVQAKLERQANKIKLRDDYLRDLLEEEYEVDTLLSTKVINSSVFSDPELRYSQEFTVKNMFSKAGKNILFDLGKLIGSQLSLDEKDLERKNDIFYSYPCIYSYDITVALPDGYYADKFDAFNVSMDNSCMSLQSQVTVEGNQLHFTFRKEYKNSFDTKDKWPKYVEVLEAAYKITQQKLVLKPL